MLTAQQGNDLIAAIETNYNWAFSKGCTITDARLFIETIIRQQASIESWKNEGLVVEKNVTVLTDHESKTILHYLQKLRILWLHDSGCENVNYPMFEELNHLIEKFT